MSQTVSDMSSDKKTDKIGARVKKDLKTSIKKIAKDNDRSVSYVVEIGLNFFIQELNRQTHNNIDLFFQEFNRKTDNNGKQNFISKISSA